MAKLWRVEYVGTLGSGATFVTTYHYVERTELLEDAASADGVCQNVSAKLLAAYKALLPNTAHVVSIKATQAVRVWAPYHEIPEAAEAAVDTYGTVSVSAPKLPAATAAKISIKSNAATRGGHGWQLIPAGVTAGWVDANSKWTSSYLTALNAYAALLDDNVTWGTLPTHTLEPVVYSRTRHMRGDENYYFDVNSAIARPDPTWLRSRISVP